MKKLLLKFNDMTALMKGHYQCTGIGFVIGLIVGYLLG
jgi:uncharacterized membrane protein (Fun14 family)